MRSAQNMVYHPGQHKGNPALHPVGVHPSQHTVALSFRNSKQVFRLQVLNVPSYLQPDEFKSQFANCEGLVSASFAKDEAGCVHLAAVVGCLDQVHSGRLAMQRV